MSWTVSFRSAFARLQRSSQSTFSRNKNGILKDCSRNAIEVTNVPYYYHVHLNMPCNQRCIMCVPDGKHSKDLLSFEGFVEFFEKIRPFAEHITLIGGEPLLYPWINQVLELLAAHPIAVTINTNATLLNEEISLRLLALHELNLKCSIDAASGSTYYRIRGTDMFQRVTDNLRRFSDRARTRPNIHIIPVYVVMRENLGEVLPFIDFAQVLHPHRVEFHPVRHVTKWYVTNNTGWKFDGREQSCEFFRDDYNSTMKQAALVCESKQMTYEVQYL